MTKISQAACIRATEGCKPFVNSVVTVPSRLSSAHGVVPLDQRDGTVRARTRSGSPAPRMQAACGIVLVRWFETTPPHGGGGSLVPQPLCHWLTHHRGPAPPPDRHRGPGPVRRGDRHQLRRQGHRGRRFRGTRWRNTHPTVFGDQKKFYLIHTYFK